MVHTCNGRESRGMYSFKMSYNHSFHLRIVPNGWSREGPHTEVMLVWSLC